MVQKRRTAIIFDFCERDLRQKFTYLKRQIEKRLEGDSGCVPDPDVAIIPEMIAVVFRKANYIFRADQMLTSKS